MAPRSVPFFNYSGFFAQHREAYLGLLEDVLSRGAFILQKEVTAFEERLAAYLGVRHAIGVANCTDGLEMALQAAGLGAGDEVILPSHTFVATASAVHAVGGVAVPVECGEDHLMDPDAIEAAITGKTRAIMPVQLNGRTCRMDRIMALAHRHNLLVIEDAAQALGSSFKGKKAGTFGLAAAYSFYPAKTLGCFGDGGAVVTNDDRVARVVRLARDHGRNADGDCELWGRNSRLDNVQAAILNFNLARYDEIVARRREIARRYDAGLRGVAQLRLPPAPGSHPDHFDIFQNYEIEAERRDELRAALKEVGIGTLVQWGGKAVHQLRTLGFTQQLPRTDALFTRCCMLPMNLMVGDDDVAYVCEQIRSFYRA